MSRITLTLSAEARENMEKIQKILSEELGGARVTPGFAVGYALKKCIDAENKNREEK